MKEFNILEMSKYDTFILLYRIYTNECMTNKVNINNILTIKKYYNTLYIKDLRKRKIENIKWKMYGT